MLFYELISSVVLIPDRPTCPNIIHIVYVCVLAHADHLTKSKFDCRAVDSDLDFHVEMLCGNVLSDR